MTFVGNVQIIAGGAEAVDTVLALLKADGVVVEGNQDLSVRAYNQFGVEEARDLRSRAVLRPVGDRRIFVTVTPSITTEAQNALLKTLEEPPANALFIFIVPSPLTLLTTLRSRAHIVEQKNYHRVDTLVDAETFLAAVPSKRLDLLKPLLEKGDDEKRDLSSIIAFLADMEVHLGKSRNSAGLAAIFTARKYITDKGALVKPLLEQVALICPQM